MDEPYVKQKKVLELEIVTRKEEAQAGVFGP